MQYKDFYNDLATRREKARLLTAMLRQASKTLRFLLLPAIVLALLLRMPTALLIFDCVTGIMLFSLFVLLSNVAFTRRLC